MTRRDFLVVAGAARCAWPAATRRPNILLAILDDCVLAFRLDLGARRRSKTPSDLRGAVGDEVETAAPPHLHADCQQHFEVRQAGGSGQPESRTQRFYRLLADDE